MAGKVNFEELAAETIAKLPVPEKPSPGARGYFRRMKAYYEANKEQILAEVKKCGETPTRKRWGIASSTWVNLKRRWGLPLLKRGGNNRQIKTRPSKTPAPAGRAKDDGAKTSPLPAFPEWNETWADRVKMAWLAAYAEMGRS